MSIHQGISITQNVRTEIYYDRSIYYDRNIYIHIHIYYIHIYNIYKYIQQKHFYFTNILVVFLTHFHSVCGLINYRLVCQI